MLCVLTNFLNVYTIIYLYIDVFNLSKNGIIIYIYMYIYVLFAPKKYMTDILRL